MRTESFSRLLCDQIKADHAAMLDNTLGAIVHVGLGLPRGVHMGACDTRLRFRWPT